MPRNSLSWSIGIAVAPYPIAVPSRNGLKIGIFGNTFDFRDNGTLKNNQTTLHYALKANSDIYLDELKTLPDGDLRKHLSYGLLPKVVFTLACSGPTTE